MDELKPAQPQSLGERLLGLMYGGTDAESEYYKRQAREAELRRMEQKAFEDQGGGLEAQIPGGNPEVPTPLDALVGALMSMGGVPPSVARSGTAPTIPAPRPAQKNSLITSEPEWMSSAPGGRTKVKGESSPLPEPAPQPEPTVLRSDYLSPAEQKKVDAKAARKLKWEFGGTYSVGPRIVMEQVKKDNTGRVLARRRVDSGTGKPLGRR